jgi:hypothetical protein
MSSPEATLLDRGGLAPGARSSSALLLLAALTLVPACNRAQAVDSPRGEPAMKSLLEVEHVTVSIDRSPADVYAFTSQVENVPRWAAGLARGVERVDGEWVGDSPMGRVKIRFARPNDLGVLDHDVVLPSGETVHNPMRVVPNGAGSEVTFTLFRRPGVSDDEFRSDAAAVRKDLDTLKRVLEK